MPAIVRYRVVKVPTAPSPIHAKVFVTVGPAAIVGPTEEVVCRWRVGLDGVPVLVHWDIECKELGQWPR